MDEPQQTPPAMPQQPEPQPAPQPPVTPSPPPPPPPPPPVAPGAESAPQAVPPPAAIAEEPGQHRTPSGLPAFKWDARTQNIAIWSVVASIVLAYINQVGAYLSARFFVGGILKAVDPTGTLGKVADVAAPTVGFNFGLPLTNGIVSGLITAAILYFLYAKIFEWVQKQSWGKYFNTFFKLIFYPYLVGAAIGTLLGSLASLMGALIMLIFSVAGHYAYAKLLDMKIGHYFSKSF